MAGSRTCKVTFDPRLLNYISCGKDNKAQLLIYQKEVNAYDDYGTLLHYAARCNNADMARYLLRRGSYVDRFGQGNKTPLMIAIESSGTATVKVLLEANANVDLVNADGKSALQMILEGRYGMSEKLRLVLNKLQTEATSTEGLAAKLITAGCTLRQAIVLNNIDLLESMVNQGTDVNSKNFEGKTALLAAAKMQDLCLVEWLIKKGANVDALDKYGESALSTAAFSANKTLLQLLLEQGSDPNMEVYKTQFAPLYLAVFSSQDDTRVIECIELLLQYGTIPCNPTKYFYTIFDVALVKEHSNRAEYLIAQLPLLEKKGTSINKSIIRCNFQKYQIKLEQLADYYKLCEEVLETAMFRSMSLFNLLTDSIFKMRTFGRNKEFNSKIKEVCFELGLSIKYPYYYKTLMKRVTKVANLVKLENIAIPIICGFFNDNGTEYYIAARKVVDYLNEDELEQLTQV